MSEQKYKYKFNCVEASRHLQKEFLRHAIDNSKEITYNTFVKNIGNDYFKEFIKENFTQYETNSKKGLTFKNDWHISYHKSYFDVIKDSKRKRYIVYYFRHSSIEYLFY